MKNSSRTYMWAHARSSQRRSSHGHAVSSLIVGVCVCAAVAARRGLWAMRGRVVIISPQFRCLTSF
eukprot:4861450-Pleurochrysis_carterae.AAC.1